MKHRDRQNTHVDGFGDIGRARKVQRCLLPVANVEMGSLGVKEARVECVCF
jgi:hypothetical protein